MLPPATVRHPHLLPTAHRPTVTTFRLQQHPTVTTVRPTATVRAMGPATARPLPSWATVSDTAMATAMAMARLVITKD